MTELQAMLRRPHWWQRPAWFIAALSTISLATMLSVAFLHPTIVTAISRGWPFRTQTTKLVALTFDDGPNGTATRHMVDILKKNNVPATFFMIGENIAADPATAKYAADRGFLIGNHTWDHDWNIPSMTHDEIMQELTTTSEAITAATQQHAQYMRWPHGLHGRHFDAWAQELNLEPVYWQVDPRDYSTNNADLLVERVLSDTHPGDIILLHDNMQDGQYMEQLHDRQTTLTALPKIISGLRAKGFTFVSITELESVKNNQ